MKLTILKQVAAALLFALPMAVLADDSTNTVVAAHAPDLVALKGDDVAKFNADQFLKAHYTILFYSAGWCPDCRAFAPTLVKTYNAQPAGSGRFEVLLISQDRSAKDMRNYMKEEGMKWPALAYDKVAGATDLAKFYSGHGIPCLTVIDATGKVVIQSKSDQDAKETLKHLQDLLATKS